MENLDPVQENQDPELTSTSAQSPAITPSPTPTVTAAPSTFTWKDKVGVDLSNSPTLQKFENTPEGLKKAMESHLSLEKLLGHEKVPLPKGPNDTEGWARFNKALGIPDKPEGYNLPDPQLPEALKDLTFDKATFSQIALENKLTPAQAQGLWKKYTELTGSAYQKNLKEFQDKLDANINALRSEWGDAYASKIELGDMVIAKFADDQETADFLTVSLSKDPKGMKFLAKLGTQFAENKIGGFQYKKFAMSPEDAAAEVSRIKSDPKHPYLNDKAPEKEHNEAVDYVNRLIAISLKKQA